MSEKTTIQITKKVRERLKKYGNKGETYDELLDRLLDVVENHAK